MKASSPWNRTQSIDLPKWIGANDTTAAFGKLSTVSRVAYSALSLLAFNPRGNTFRGDKSDCIVHRKPNAANTHLSSLSLRNLKQRAVRGVPQASLAYAIQRIYPAASLVE